MSNLYRCEPLSEYLKNARMEKCLTQSEVAIRLGFTSAQFVSNWERGITCPSVSTISKLIKIYSLDSNEVFRLCIQGAEQNLRRAMKSRSAERRQFV
jgi:transcriptional regulator with XRE-family HTH domain